MLQEWSFSEWEEVRSPAPQTWLGVEAQRPPVYGSATLPPGTAPGPDQQDRGLPRGQDPPLAPARPPFVPSWDPSLSTGGGVQSLGDPRPRGRKQLPALTRSAAGVNFPTQDEKEDLVLGDSGAPAPR